MRKINFIQSQFQDFTYQVAERANPQPGDENTYIGLEHLSPNRLYVKKWGGDVELKGQKFSIKKGDVLFAKRNAYLKRVAVSPIDGIFSAHGMVFRPKGNTFIKGFLPYFLLSSAFWNRAIAISEGSLSPTIKWNTLAKQTFSIPDTESQKAILPALDNLTSQELQINELLISIDQSIRSFQKSIFGNYFDVSQSRRVPLPKNWTKAPVSELLHSPPESGNSLHVVDRETNRYVLNLNCLTKDGFSPNGYKAIDSQSFPLELLLNEGDVLISRSNTIDLVGLIGLYADTQKRKAIFPDTMWRLRINEEVVDKSFFVNYFLSPFARREIQRIAAGSSGSMKKINKKGFGKILVPVPPKGEQIEINRILKNFFKTQSALADKLEKTCSLRLNLVDEFTNEN